MAKRRIEVPNKGDDREKQIRNIQESARNAFGITPRRSDIEKHLGENVGEHNPGAPPWLIRSMGSRPMGGSSDE